MKNPRGTKTTFLTGLALLALAGLAIVAPGASAKPSIGSVPLPTGYANIQCQVNVDPGSVGESISTNPPFVTLDWTGSVLESCSIPLTA